METGLFEPAASCFDRAGDPARAAHCMARHAQRRGAQLLLSAPAEGAAALRRVGLELLHLAVSGRVNLDIAPPTVKDKVRGARPDAAPLKPQRRRERARAS